MMDLSTVIVHDDVEAPGMFSLRLLNWDMFQLKMTWVDDELFAVGNAVEIALGYVDNLKTLIVARLPVWSQSSAQVNRPLSRYAAMIVVIAYCAGARRARLSR